MILKLFKKQGNKNPTSDLGLVVVVGPNPWPPRSSPVHECLLEMPAEYPLRSLDHPQKRLPS